MNLQAVVFSLCFFADGDSDVWQLFSGASGGYGSKCDGVFEAVLTSTAAAHEQYSNSTGSNSSCSYGRSYRPLPWHIHKFINGQGQFSRASRISNWHNYAKLPIPTIMPLPLLLMLLLQVVLVVMTQLQHQNQQQNQLMLTSSSSSRVWRDPRGSTIDQQLPPPLLCC